MVVFSEHYRFCGEEVEAIGAYKSTSATHPFGLCVYLKSGKTLSVNYQDDKSRCDAMSTLARQIDIDRRRDKEQNQIALSILRDTVNRIDKRQLRIWRQLKQLLGVKDGEEEHESES